MINGNATDVSEGYLLSDLIVSLKLPERGTVVELNQTAIFPRDYSTTRLHADDQIEVITISAGG